MPECTPERTVNTWKKTQERVELEQLCEATPPQPGRKDWKQFSEVLYNHISYCLSKKPFFHTLKSVK